MNELFEKGKKFLKDIKEGDRVLLIHHMDGDGYCSGALLLYALNKMGKKAADVEGATNEDLENIVKSGQMDDYDKVIIVDIDAPYLKRDMESFEGRILIIDHHAVRGDMNDEKVMYVNPRMVDKKIYQPASYVVYRFLSSIVDIEEKEWLSVLGTVADLGFEDCRDLLDKWMDVKTREDITKTEFWKVSNLLYAAIIVKSGGLIDLLLGASGLEDIEKNEKLLSANKEFDKAYAKVEEEFWENAEEIGKMIISRTSPPLRRLGSSLATNIGLKNPDKVILVLEKRGENLKISARSQSEEIHLGKIMNSCASLGGGGHKRAAGGMIRSSDYEDFKKCVLSKISETGAE